MGGIIFLAQIVRVIWQVVRTGSLCGVGDENRSWRGHHFLPLVPSPGTQSSTQRPFAPKIWPRPRWPRETSLCVLWQ
ncbi:hypothetical protein Pmani_000732 [Petrolisthes manimaculis]|uniref:Secreted protein n=1 Tax=Petrolisthes manimaculis TaxID=1843537 RepID=A0AAE1QPA2_9EUCA|nr:hypothetical protein Pmani_000732 [Petrolisthes manimaculis]